MSSLAIHGDPVSGFYTRNPNTGTRSKISIPDYLPRRERPVVNRPTVSSSARQPPAGGQQTQTMPAYSPAQSSAPDMSVYKPNPYVSQSQFQQMFSPGQAQPRQQSFGTAYRPNPSTSPPGRTQINNANMPQERIDAGRTPFGGIIQDGRVIGGDYMQRLDGQGRPIDWYGNPTAQGPVERPAVQNQGYFNMFPRQPSQVSTSGDPRGMYAMAPIDQRPAPFTVDSMYGPMGETSNPFADRDAILERIMSLNMDRQMRFNQTAPFPMSYGSPFLDYSSLTAS